MGLFEIDRSVLGDSVAKCLDDWNIEGLTEVQHLAIAAGIHRGKSAIVCAPTSSGKTLVGELALASALNEDAYALYLVSHKALAEQKYADFCRRFAPDRFAAQVSVAISTGDHEEGDIRSRLLVSTYEKALGLVLAGRLRIPDTVIIADELQLLSDPARGASVETLCALLRQRRPKQFVGLTATAANPEEVAEWMNCETVACHTRDVTLYQHICYDGKRHTVRFGDEDGQTFPESRNVADLHSLVRSLVTTGQGPVLVFTETRGTAAALATDYSQKCQSHTDGVRLSNQLSLFSEPTESSQALRHNAERRVAFHSADLTPDERSVVEAGFVDSRFDVCFATSTLAAGVNFPFRSVIFPSVFYRFRDDPRMPLADYRNMSGRAGRLGLHPDGHAYLLPQNHAQLAHANRLVLPTNEEIESQLVSLSMRRTILGLIAAGAASTHKEMESFFKNSFYWHQTKEHNPKKLETIISKAAKAVEWLVEGGYLTEKERILEITSLGRATAHSGLLPETAERFIDLLRQKPDALTKEFNEHVVGMLHWVVSCPEYTGDPPTRFLPYVAQDGKPESRMFVKQRKLLIPLDEEDGRTCAAVHAISLFIGGVFERQIQFSTRISSGYIHRLAADVAWVLEGLRSISAAKELALPQGVTNQLGLLARRVRWGVPVDGLDMLRIAVRARVPGFRRQRLMALSAQGITSIADVLATPIDRLERIVQGKERAVALVEALSKNLSDAAVEYSTTHVEVAAEIGVDEKVLNCQKAFGTEYEPAIVDLLSEDPRLVVDVIDDGKRQNVPDFSITLGDTSLIIDCKTATKKPPLVNKEDAWAILQKAADFPAQMRRVTLGKPDFDETSKTKAAVATDITLVRHEVFMEGLLRVLTGRLSAEDFMNWLAEPGVTELERLPGTPTYVAAPA